MLLTNGTRLGPYEIISALGAGGMGEVYRARDPRLGRDVALKVLPAFSTDSDHLRRFEQEARAAAALNHPNILAVYDIGETDGSPYIVSELLEGQTLREALAGGGLTVKKAVDYAVQICHGLTAAHEKGIVHRDLKPENIFVTTNGRVKILDFGLAKLMRAEPAFSGVSALPTTPPGTMPGVVLGTVGYMSPEQVRGVTADQRADIFALGAILHEMLSGQRAFRRDTAAETMTAILNEEPAPLPAVDRHIPASLERIVDRCLAKSASARFTSADDLAFALEGLSSASGTAATVAAPGRRHRLALMLGVLLAVAAAAILTTRTFRQPVVADAPEMRLEVTTPPTDDPVSLAISPDGQKLVFSATVEGKTQLWLRSLNAVGAQPLAATDGARFPFWSPDARSIAFFAEATLKRIDVAGGPAQKLTLVSTVSSGGGTWNRDGVMLFGFGVGPINRIAAGGGTAVAVTRVDSRRQTGHRSPQFLPDGRHFLYFAVGSPEDRGVYVAALDEPLGRRLFAADSAAVYVPPGFLLFLRQGTLVAQRFDAATLAPAGEPIKVAGQVAVDRAIAGPAAVSAAATGALAYRASVAPGRRQLVWVDRSGTQVGTVGGADQAAPSNVELSPDGTRVAINRVVNGNIDIWLLETGRDVTTRFTFDTAVDNIQVWSPDGRRIIFSSNRAGGTYDLYDKPASGAGAEALLLSSPFVKAPEDWSADGRFLLYRVVDPKTGRDFWALPLEGKREPVVVRKTEFEELQGQISPDGRWVVYTSNQSGPFDIYVQAFPTAAGSWQVSTGGGVQPRWRRDGKELFYIAPDGRLMAVPIAVAPDGQALQPGRPLALFQTHLAGGATVVSSVKHQYAVARDGRFLIARTLEETTASPITIVLNWAGGKK